MGGIYEVDKTAGGTVTKTTIYYPGGAMRINGTLYFVLKDHLGSASVVTDSSGNIVGESRYYPYGETRLTTGTMQTDQLFTGQREIAGLGIYHYGARFYSPKLGRFLSADTMVPNPANPQAFNRYSYVYGNPLRYVDPSGNIPIDCWENPRYCSNTTTLPSSPYRSTPPPPRLPPNITPEHDERLRDLREEAEALSESMQQGEITDLEALELLLDVVAEEYSDDVDGALMNLGIVVGGLDTTGVVPRQIDENNPDDPLYRYYVGYSAFDPEQTGFALRLNPNNDNQVRHFLAGTAGYSATGGIGGAFLWLQEDSPADRALYLEAFEFVVYLVLQRKVRSESSQLNQFGFAMRVISDKIAFLVIVHAV